MRFKNELVSIFTLGFFLVSTNLTGQPQYSQNETLNQYIQQGLENNLALQQRDFSFQHSRAVLKEARGLFMPSVNIEARYSRAGGGRIIEFPVGDLLNNVYFTLNGMLEQQGQGRPFPENLANEKINFLREEEHDTKIRAVQPIFNASIYYNYKIKSDLQNSSEAEMQAYKRLLIEEIKAAYYNYLKTEEIVRLYQKTMQLVQENVRVTQKLVDVDKATPDLLYRAQTELYKIEQHNTEAENNKNLARAFFNFLINKPLDSPVVKADALGREAFTDMDLDAAVSQALKRREELKQLSNGSRAAQNAVRLTNGRYLPNLNLVLDYGFEGEKYNFNKDNDYWMASAVLSWNLFEGFQTNARKQQAVLEKKKVDSRYDEVKRQIRLQVEEARKNLAVSMKKIQTARQMVKSAEASFKIVSRKYAQGMSSQIEYLDAQTNLTNSEINLLVNRYDSLIKLAVFERVTAGLEL